MRGVTGGFSMTRGAAGERSTPACGVDAHAASNRIAMLHMVFMARHHRKRRLSRVPVIVAGEHTTDHRTDACCSGATVAVFNVAADCSSPHGCFLNHGCLLSCL